MRGLRERRTGRTIARARTCGYASPSQRCPQDSTLRPAAAPILRIGEEEAMALEDLKAKGKELLEKAEEKTKRAAAATEEKAKEAMAAVHEKAKEIKAGARERIEKK